MWGLLDFFLGWGSLYKHRRTTLGKNLAISKGFLYVALYYLTAIIEVIFNTSMTAIREFVNEREMFGVKLSFHFKYSEYRDRSYSIFALHCLSHGIV